MGSERNTEDETVENRMRKAATSFKCPTLREMLFEQLLVTVRELTEARLVLKRAVALAPAGYDLPRNNLKELENRRSHVV